MTTKTYRACNLCEAICGLEIELEGANVVAIRGDPLDPLSWGHICPKGTALADIYNDPNRLRFPVKRTPNGWQQISWDEAFEIVSSQLLEIKTKNGADAIASYLGNPVVHNSGTLMTVPGLLKAIGSRQRYSATSVDQLPHQVASGLMFGHPGLFAVPDLDRTDYWLMLGANPLASNGSMMTAPGVASRIKGIQARGGKVVVIDPRRTETARAADEHHFVQPGSDALLLLAMVNTLFAENLVNFGALKAFTDGIEDVRNVVTAYTPERVAAQVGLDAPTIRRLTLEFAAAKSAVIYGRIGISLQRFGGLCQWLINVINVLTGNLDRVGGSMFPSPALDLIRSKGDWEFGRYRTRVRNLPEFNGEFPVAALTEEITTPGEGQIKALVLIGGNPVLSTPNGQQLEAAMQQLEFCVAVDIYITETTQHAHVILPPATGLETAHYDLAFHTLAVRNTARWNTPSVPKAEGMKFDWEILGELTQRLGGDAPRDPAILIDRGLKAGKYGLGLESLATQPHGVDLGALEPQLPARLQNPEKRIRLAPTLYFDDLKRLAAELEAAELEGFALIGRRELRTNNSWMHHVARLNRDQPRCTAMMHPSDAARLNFESGQSITLQSRVGAVTLPLEITPDIAPGVISVPHGYGHAARDDVPNQSKGVSINDLTDSLIVDMTGNAALNSVRVTVTRA